MVGVESSILLFSQAAEEGAKADEPEELAVVVEVSLGLLVGLGWNEEPRVGMLFHFGVPVT